MSRKNTQWLTWDETAFFALGMLGLAAFSLAGLSYYGVWPFTHSRVLALLFNLELVSLAGINGVDRRGDVASMGAVVG